MRRRQFLKVTLKISAAGGLVLSGATVAHRLIWDYAQAPEGAAGPGSGSGDGPGLAAGHGTAASQQAGSAPAGRCLSGREYVIVRAAALRVLDGAEPDPHADGAARQCAFIDGYLSQLEEGLRRDVKALLSLLELYPLATGSFTRFSRLDPAAQDAVLMSWETSRTALLRQGLQALKAMCLLAHYQDERSFASIGYSGPLVPAQGLGRVLPAP